MEEGLEEASGGGGRHRLGAKNGERLAGQRWRSQRGSSGGGVVSDETYEGRGGGGGGDLDDERTMTVLGDDFTGAVHQRGYNHSDETEALTTHESRERRGVDLVGEGRSNDEKNRMFWTYIG